MSHFPPRKILVPFDFSERAHHAWRYAQDLAAACGARLSAVYVSPMNVTSEAVIMDSLSPAQILRLRDRMAEELGVGGDYHVMESDVEFAILRAIKELHADLVVMATAGVTGLRRLAHESVTETVVRSSPVPVLSLHADVRMPRSILAPVNFAEYSLEGFYYAEKLALLLGARLTLFHVEEGAVGAATARRDLEAAVHGRASGVKCEVKVAGGRVIDKLLEEAARHDLVVLVSHGTGAFHDAMIGTTAEQALRRSLTPVVCVPVSSPLTRARRRTRPSPRRASVNRRARRRVARARVV